MLAAAASTITAGEHDKEEVTEEAFPAAAPETGREGVAEFSMW